MSDIKYLGNKGLINLGNTCYMNSIFQCLSHLLIFHPKNKDFSNECIDINKDSLINEWLRFQKFMWENNDYNTINPSKLLSTFKDNCVKYNSWFDSFHQNDVDEFLVLFLDYLHKSIPCTMDIVSYNSHNNKDIDKIIKNSQDIWRKFYSNDYSYIVEQFYSQLLSYTTCPKCNYYTTNHDPVQVLSLEISPRSKTLYDCLDDFTKSTNLDDDNLWTCDNCHDKVKSQKKTLLWKTSDVIIISLKRFNQLTKINKFIEYPDILTLTNYNLNYGTSKINKYCLQSLAIHVGGLEGGHYYSVCKNHITKNWYKYDDEVSTIYNDNYLNELPYILFYKRC